MKIHEAVKKIKRLAPPKNLLSKQKMDLPEMKKAVRDHPSQNISKKIVIQMQRQCRTITNIDVNILYIIRNKRNSIDFKK